MRKLITGMFLLFLTLGLTASLTATSLSFSATSNPSNSQTQEIDSRIAGLELPLTAPASDAYLQRKLKDYLATGSHSTEKMLGRANRYFPVFEHYLAKHGMPESLKYLAVAESMLVPRAVSGASAAGLWQLMPVTAREMGLRVDHVVDERLDLHRSTEAAVLMLKDLYAQFGDWHLALAAYNCGPGRVRRAVRHSGGYTQYGKVKPYLPKETQRYVAAYVAAAYTVNYYGDHGLTPAAHLSEDSIAQFKVYRTINLRKLARARELDYATLRRLNPGYVQGYIPRNPAGYTLRVPSTDLYAAQTYVWGRPNMVTTARNGDDDHSQMESFVSDLGYSSVYWLLGCREVYFEHEPPLVFTETVRAWDYGYYNTYSAVAML